MQLPSNLAGRVGAMVVDERALIMYLVRVLAVRHLSLHDHVPRLRGHGREVDQASAQKLVLFELQ